jgi:hypothetical protein
MKLEDGALQIDEWRKITSYEEYEISSSGIVRHAGKILKKYIEKNGYERVSLSKNKTYKLFYVHRLVAQEFIANHGIKAEVNHIDGNKANNCASNLEWVSRKDNILHSFHVINTNRSPSLGKFGSENHSSKPFAIKYPNGEILLFAGAAEFARRTGLSKHAICRARMKGKLRHTFHQGNLKNMTIIFDIDQLKIEEVGDEGSN